jgi:cystathionine gamma-synthase
MHIRTLAVHCTEPDVETGAVIPPIHLSSTFEREPDGTLRGGFNYTREGNPTRASLERTLATLDGGAAALSFSSGSAAASALLMALGPGDHVVIADDVYHGTRRLIAEHFVRWGLGVTPVDLTDIDSLRAAMTPATRMVWVESPSNPLLKIADIAAIADVARSARAVCVCDNTWSTPMITRPLDLGADIAMYSTTKYIGGHSDLLGGAVVGREHDGFFERVKSVQRSAGGVPSPFDCWLTLRGIRTLPVRMAAHSASALRVAEYLSGHAAVERVRYPGLTTHPAHDLARRQMSSPGGMLSAEFTGGREHALGVASRLRLFVRATSLGGTESLVEHRASIEGPESRTPDSLLRFSVGLEHPDDLIADLAQALETT